VEAGFFRGWSFSVWLVSVVALFVVTLSQWLGAAAAPLLPLLRL
jgi:hypothetical protein